MENSSFPQLLCAAVPEEAAQMRPYPLLSAHLAYRVGNGPRLYRNVPPDAVRGGVLMAGDEALEQIGAAAVLCRQVIRECRARSALGFCANWSRVPDEAMRTVTASLGAALAREGLSFWVTEPYGDCSPTAQVLISSALSGGTLRQRLTEAMERFGAQRVTLAVERMASDFILPAKTGQGKALRAEELQALRERYHPAVYYSAEFCAYYFTYSRGNLVHFVLFDTGESIRRKLLLAKQLGLGWAMVAWAEICGCVEEIFSPKPRQTPQDRRRRY